MAAPVIADILGSYRQQWATGSVTTLAGGDRMLSVRYQQATAAIALRIRALEVEFITTTAFTAAQEVGWESRIVRGYTVSPTGQTQITIGADGKRRGAYPTSSLNGVTCDVRVANAGAITPGTETTPDTNPFARGSFWSTAIGAQFAWRRNDFSTLEPGGILLGTNEGIVIKNSITMGAAGVGRWLFTFEWEDVLLGN